MAERISDYSMFSKLTHYVSTNKTRLNNPQRHVLGPRLYAAGGMPVCLVNTREK